MKNGKFQYVYEGKPERQVIETFERYILDKLLKETKEFYSRFVHENETMTVIDYLNAANRYLNEEKDRENNSYPVKEFRDQVSKCYKKELIEKPGNDLISRSGDGLLNMLKTKDEKYTQILYEFIMEIKFDLSKFIAEIVEYIKSKIKALKHKVT